MLSVKWRPFCPGGGGGGGGGGVGGVGGVDELNGPMNSTVKLNIRVILLENNRIQSHVQLSITLWWYPFRPYFASGENLIAPLNPITSGSKITPIITYFNGNSKLHQSEACLQMA